VFEKLPSKGDLKWNDDYSNTSEVENEKELETQPRLKSKNEKKN